MIGFADDALKDEIVLQTESVTKKILFEPKGVVLLQKKVFLTKSTKYDTGEGSLEL